MMHGVTVGEHATHSAENGVAGQPLDVEVPQDTDVAANHCTDTVTTSVEAAVVVEQEEEETAEEGKEEEKEEEEKEGAVTKVVVEDLAPFTEYVNMDAYRRESRSSVESDDSFDGTEEQLMMMFKMGQHKQLKKLLRITPWPEDHLIRHSLWLSLCKHLHKADGNLYEEMEKELFSESDMSEKIPLPGFLDQSHLTSYYLSERGVHLIGRIITIINHTNPDITYSPATFAISSLFLHYMGPSETFNCLYALLHSKDTTYISQTKVSLEASKYVLRDLTKKFAKSAYVHLVRHSKNVENIFDNWIWWIYRDLPFFFLVKLTDCFLMEGVKVLYRAVLAILILYTKTSGKLKSSMREPVSINIANNISRFCEKMPVDIDKFLKIAFGIRGLSRKEIHKLEVKHEMYINSRQILSRDLPRVASSHSLGAVQGSRPFSGAVLLHHNMNSHILMNEMPEARARSRSLGMHVLHNVRSSIVTPEELQSIWSWLPARLAVCQPELLYTSEEHGTSLRTLYTKIERHPQTIILIKTTNNEIFGAFCSAPWYQRKSRDKNLSYFGTGETFLFSLHPNKEKFEWVGLWKEDIPNTANMFLAGDTSELTIGGGNGEAIKLDENLMHCRTESCDTFDNSPFCEDKDFTCKVVEAYGFR